MQGPQRMQPFRLGFRPFRIGAASPVGQHLRQPLEGTAAA